MAGTGNLLLKRGSVMPYNRTQDDAAGDTDLKVLLKGMPAAQIVGLSPYYATAGNSEALASANAKYIGTSTVDYPNRLWLGTDGYATSDTEGTDDGGTVRPYAATGATTFGTTGYTRPLWVGAEIRASEPITEDGIGITFTGKISIAPTGANLTITSGSISGGTLAAGMRIEVMNTNVTPNTVYPILEEGSHLYSGSGLSWTVLPRPPALIQTTTGGDLTFRAYPNPYVVLKANWDRPSDYVLVTQKAISAMPLRVWEEKGDPVHATGQAAGTIGIKEYVDFSAWDGVGTSEPTNRTISNNTVIYFPDATNYITPTALEDAILVANIANTSTDPKRIYLKWSTTAAALQSYTSATSGSDFALLGSNGATKGKQTFLSPIGIENYLELLPYSDGVSNLPATIKSTTVGAASIFDENITDLSIGGAAELIEIGNGSTGGNTATTIYGELTVTGPTNLSSDTVIDGGTF